MSQVITRWHARLLSDRIFGISLVAAAGVLAASQLAPAAAALPSRCLAAVALLLLAQDCLGLDVDPDLVAGRA